MRSGYPDSYVLKCMRPRGLRTGELWARKAGKSDLPLVPDEREGPGVSSSGAEGHDAGDPDDGSHHRSGAHNDYTVCNHPGYTAFAV